jgi:outer membrane biosynthesis protein TonB
MADSARRDQATVLEVPVTIQGAKHVEGSEQRQIFTETTKTTIVFGNGAVVNLSSKVTQGQCVFLRNERTGREILCKVLEWRQVAESGYVDLEFTTRDPNFWDAPVMQEPAVAAPVIPAPVVATPASKPVEAQEKVLGVSDPTPDAAPVAQSSAPAGEVAPAVSAETAAAAEAASAERAARLTEMMEEPPETEEEAAQNDSKDAELLAALIAKDPKRKPKREAAPAEARESEFDAMSEDRAEQGEAGAHVENENDGERDGRAKLIAMLRPVAHRLHRFTYGKGAIQVGIAASFLLVVLLGMAWHSHRVKVRNSKQAVAAALAQAKHDAAAQSPATTGKPSGESEAPAHGNNSGATPAQAAQKIQLQTGAPAASAANANNATAYSAPSGVLSATAASAAPTVASAAPKLHVRDIAPDAELDASGQPKHRHTKGPNGGETIPARIVAQPPPAIPKWAKGLDTDGVVTVDALIDEKGNLRATKALSGPRVLQHEAERAVALWIFEPALTDGKPTATHMVLTVQFQR